MLVKFSEVGINEHFCFADDDYGWIGDCIKISPQRYALCTTHKPVIVRTLYATRLCKVDNSCTCTEPRPLTFNDLSIGSIFQFSSTWSKSADHKRIYDKVDKLHYRKMFSWDKIPIINTNIVVATPDYVQYAQ